MLSRKIFENLRSVMAILKLFEQFQANFFHIFVTYFECFTKYDAFCLHSFDYACLKQLRHIVLKRFENIEEFHTSKALLKMAGGGGIHPPHRP